MPLQILKPSQMRHSRTLIFGEVGSGKTHFLGGLALDERTSPALILDFEGGVDSLVGLDIDVGRVRDWSDYEEAYEMLANGSKYCSVAIDSASETHVFALMNILQQEEEERGKRGQGDLLFEGDYGKALIQMRRLLRAFRDLPMHVFLTAQMMEGSEPGIGTVKKPSFAGKLANEVPGLMNVVGYLTWGAPDPKKPKEEERVLILKNHPRVKAKARTPFYDTEIPDYLWKPTVTSFLNALRFEA